MGRYPQDFTHDAAHDHIRSIEELDAAFLNRVQHRLNISRRAAGHVEDFPGGGLLLECLRELDVSIFWVEQPHVLDRDDCFVNEVLSSAISCLLDNGPGFDA